MASKRAARTAPSSVTSLPVLTLAVPEVMTLDTADPSLSVRRRRLSVH
jgi:hypothetical protein